MKERKKNGERGGKKDFEGAKNWPSKQKRNGEIFSLKKFQQTKRKKPRQKI